MKLIENKDLMTHIASGNDISKKQKLLLIFNLSIPTIFSQVAFIIMQYIDAAMVGRLGADNSAAIGLMSSTTWLFSGVCTALSVGFSVQVAQYIGAKKHIEAKEVFKHSLIAVTVFGVFLLLIGIFISGIVPRILGGSWEIYWKARSYFFMYSCFLPVVGLNTLATSMLQSSGNMKLPSVLNVIMCGLDVIFNSILIFPQCKISAFNLVYTLPGANLGVRGAALGTALAELVIAAVMLYFLCWKTSIFKIKNREGFSFKLLYIKKAMKISYPVMFENVVVCGAMIVTTRIVAPLGNIALSAHSFAITAESLCYMPGYGIATAATTLVGQSIGAGRKKIAKQFAKMTMFFGMFVMTCTGIIMFLAATIMLSFLSPDGRIQQLGTLVLRIEAFAEPMYAAAIVASGALQGAGDTFIPSIMNFLSMWVVRLPLSYILAIKFGLVGVWIAMSIELCFRGSILLTRLLKGKWLGALAIKN